MTDAAGVRDVIGVGFGPANVALAVALQEEDAGGDGRDRLSVGFLEAQPRFGWHKGMLIEDATMQVSFLKDLVTMRNPLSSFSFVAYLHEMGRLSRFIDAKTLYPFRIDFHGYLEWAAGRLADRVEYGARVRTIRPVPGDGGVELFDVVAETPDGATMVRRARSVVLGCGLRPRMPEGLTRSDRVWHTADLLPGIERLAGTDPGSFVVVGAGQSAAEATHHLHRFFPRAEVAVVHSRYGFSASDDTPFANGVFGPDAVDDFFSAPPAVKRMVLGYHANTNYSVVDAELIRLLYDEVYRESLTGRQRLRIHRLSRLRGVTAAGSGLRVEIESLRDGGVAVLDADVLVCATGYLAVDPAELLAGLLPLCPRDEGGRLMLDRSRRLVTREPVGRGIYVQGYGEHTHGIAETLLSLVAQRAGELARTLIGEFRS